MSCSNRDTSPWDLSIMTLIAAKMPNGCDLKILSFHHILLQLYNTEKYALGFKSIVGETGDNINVEILEATICTLNHMSKIWEW